MEPFKLLYEILGVLSVDVNIYTVVYYTILY